MIKDNFQRKSKKKKIGARKLWIFQKKKSMIKDIFIKIEIISFNNEGCFSILCMKEGYEVKFLTILLYVGSSIKVDWNKEKEK